MQYSVQLLKEYIVLWALVPSWDGCQMIQGFDCNCYAWSSDVPILVVSTVHLELAAQAARPAACLPHPLRRPLGSGHHWCPLSRHPCTSGAEGKPCRWLSRAVQAEHMQCEVWMSVGDKEQRVSQRGMLEAAVGRLKKLSCWMLGLACVVFSSPAASFSEASASRRQSAVVTATDGPGQGSRLLWQHRIP
eukprot:1159720-Pelagomonas_calceolata.AAC.17